MMEMYLGGVGIVDVPEEISEYLRWVRGSPMIWNFPDMPYRLSVSFEFLIENYGKEPKSMLYR